MSEVDIHNAGLNEAGAAAETAEATLRLIASLPAPQGLAGRVQERLRSAERDARVIAFPAREGWFDAAWRSAAAAAIVCVVAGGAWWISAMAGAGAGTSAGAGPAPAAVRPSGGFSSAGAVRTPDTLNGPVLKKKQDEKKPAKPATDSTKKPSQKPTEKQ